LVEEAKHFDEVWRRPRLSYWVLGWVTILGGLSIPLLVALDTPKWVLASAGFVTAVAGALEAFSALDSAGVSSATPPS